MKKYDLTTLVVMTLMSSAGYGMDGYWLGDGSHDARSHAARPPRDHSRPSSAAYPPAAYPHGYPDGGGYPLPGHPPLPGGYPAPSPYGYPAPGYPPYGYPAPSPYGHPAPSPYGHPAPSPYGHPVPSPYGQPPLPSISYEYPPEAGCNFAGDPLKPGRDVNGNLIMSGYDICGRSLLPGCDIYGRVVQSDSLSRTVSSLAGATGVPPRNPGNRGASMAMPVRTSETPALPSFTPTPVAAPAPAVAPKGSAFARPTPVVLTPTPLTPHSHAIIVDGDEQAVRYDSASKKFLNVDGGKEVGTAFYSYEGKKYPITITDKGNLVFQDETHKHLISQSTWKIGKSEALKGASRVSGAPTPTSTPVVPPVSTPVSTPVAAPAPAVAPKLSTGPTPVEVAPKAKGAWAERGKSSTPALFVTAGSEPLKGGGRFVDKSANEVHYNASSKKFFNAETRTETQGIYYRDHEGRTYQLRVSDIGLAYESGGLRYLIDAESGDVVESQSLALQAPKPAPAPEVLLAPAPAPTPAIVSVAPPPFASNPPLDGTYGSVLGLQDAYCNPCTVSRTQNAFHYTGYKMQISFDDYERDIELFDSNRPKVFYTTAEANYKVFFHGSDKKLAYKDKHDQIYLIDEENGTSYVLGTVPVSGVAKPTSSYKGGKPPLPPTARPDKSASVAASAPVSRIDWQDTASGVHALTYKLAPAPVSTAASSLDTLPEHAAAAPAPRSVSNLTDIEKTLGTKFTSYQANKVTQVLSEEIKSSRGQILQVMQELMSVYNAEGRTKGDHPHPRYIWPYDIANILDALRLLEPRHLSTVVKKCSDLVFRGFINDQIKHMATHDGEVINVGDSFPVADRAPGMSLYFLSQLYSRR